MRSLHESPRELAEEVEDVPKGLAEHAWTTGRADLTRQRRTRLLASLTAVAVTGYPQRVVDPGDVDPLSAKGVPLTAIMHS
ncbi:hypothetical protein [Janibacter sp. G368]|uniref:hypothetical protein n=1 Tax=Janibacter sp. G368 TaxID=3420441 RepID=UPI003D0049B4